MSSNRYQWARAGDVKTFFGLMLDNIAGMVLWLMLPSDAQETSVEFSLGLHGGADAISTAENRHRN